MRNSAWVGLIWKAAKHKSERAHNVDIAVALVEHGSNINVRNKAGETALKMASLTLDDMMAAI